jgi:hypothetical protein
MSVTSDTSSYSKKLRWRKSYLLLVLLLLLVGVELFVDLFPRSIWGLRALSTEYLVHVRADLTIDGDPLVMDRTIRCFNLWALITVLKTAKSTTSPPPPSTESENGMDAV